MSSTSSSSSNYLLLAGTAVTASLATLAIQKIFERRRLSRRAPKRCAGAIQLRPDQYDLYTQLHDYPWEEVLDRMYKSNIRNFTIYYHEETHTMFHHFDWIGGLHLNSQKEIEAKFLEDMTAIAQDPATREWWSYCEPCQKPFQQWPADEKPPSQLPVGQAPKGDWWAPLECLNHCGYWPVEYSNQKRDPEFVRKNPERKISTRTNPPKLEDVI